MYPVLGLVSGVLYGAWSFGLGRSKGAVAPNVVLLVSASAAAVGYLVAGLVADGLVVDRFDVTRGVAGGLLNVAGTLLVLKAFARGPLGVVAGVSAAYTLVPLAYAVAEGEPVSWLAGAGVVVVIAGLVVFYVPDLHSGPEASAVGGPVVLAIAGALFWGLAVIVIDWGSRKSVTTTMLMSQVPQIVFTAVMVGFVARSWGGLTRVSAATLVGAGAAVALANMAFYTAANGDDLGVVSVLSSISPVVTALLAFVVLGERMTRWQIVALVLVLVGSALVAA